MNRPFFHNVLMASLLASLILTGCGGDSGPVSVAADVDVAALIEQLSSADTEARLSACVELSSGKENSAPALDALLEVLQNDKQADVREMAIYAIYEMGPKVAKPAMPTIKSQYAKERNLKVKNVLFNTWSLVEPDTAPTLGTGAPSTP